MCQPEKKRASATYPSLAGGNPDRTHAETRDQPSDLILHCHKRLNHLRVPNPSHKRGISVFSRCDLPLPKNPADVFQIRFGTHHNEHQTPARSQRVKRSLNEGMRRCIAIVQGRI